jgi:hypothetical protein
VLQSKTRSIIGSTLPSPNVENVFKQNLDSCNYRQIQQQLSDTGDRSSSNSISTTTKATKFRYRPATVPVTASTSQMASENRQTTKSPVVVNLTEEEEEEEVLPDISLSSLEAAQRVVQNVVEDVDKEMMYLPPIPPISHPEAAQFVVENVDLPPIPGPEPPLVVENEVENEMDPPQLQGKYEASRLAVILSNFWSVLHLEI